AVALVGVAVLTTVAAFGIRRSNQTNAVIVTVTIAALLLFIVTGTLRVRGVGPEHFTPFFTDDSPGAGLHEATALMFVAYTGYGRIATLGEEVHEPRRAIPRAIIITLVVSALLYVGVGAVAIGAAGSERLAATTERDVAPLVIVARDFGPAWVPWIVGLGAITAMLGVLLNLILGLSRVLLAMARRGDAPRVFSKLDEAETTPYVAVIAVGIAIGLIAALGSVKAAWSFSAFTVLVYYGITNLAAIRLPREQRLYPAFIPWAGLISCFGLAFWVEPHIWIAGLAILAAGLAWHVPRQWLQGSGRAL
ncbi:MAG: APC family permease, partial [Candidatus Hydrogenedentales bacterium]